MNLLRSIKDSILISKRADHRRTKEIKVKLLASINGTSEAALSEALKNQRTICTDINKLKQLISRDDRKLEDNWTILYYFVTETLNMRIFLSDFRLHYSIQCLARKSDNL